jgi:hypothetical protein
VDSLSAATAAAASYSAHQALDAHLLLAAPHMQATVGNAIRHLEKQTKQTLQNLHDRQQAPLTGCMVTPQEPVRVAPRMVPVRVVSRLELIATLERPPPLFRARLSEAEIARAPSNVADLAMLPITRAGMEGWPLPRLGPPGTSCGMGERVLQAGQDRQQRCM